MIVGILCLGGALILHELGDNAAAWVWSAAGLLWLAAAISVVAL